MKTFGNVEIEGGEIINADIVQGTADPTAVGPGQLFFRTDLSQMRVYDGSAWSSMLTGTSGITGTTNQIAVTPSTGGVTLALATNVIVPTPSSGTAFTVTGAASAVGVLVTSNNGATTSYPDIQVSRGGSTANAQGEGPCLRLYDSVNGAATQWQSSGGQTELWQYNSSTWQQIAYWDVNHNFAINPANVAPFNFTIGVNDTAYSQIAFPATTNHNAINWARNANSSLAFQVYNNTSANSLFQIEDGGSTFIGPPASGTSLTISGVSGQNVMALNSGSSATTGAGDLQINRNGSTANSIGTGPSIQLEDQTATTASMFQQSGGQTELWQYNAGTWNQVTRVQTDLNFYIRDDSGAMQVAGYRGMPITAQTVNYTLQLSDRGKCLNQLTATTITVPANVFNTGDLVTITTNGSGTLTIAEGTGFTLGWANGTVTNGNRTVTAVAVVQILFLSGTQAHIWGTGLS